MECPEDITEVLSEILATAILRIRAAGWAGDAKRCAIEADHVHNLPALLLNFDEGALQYYWDVERPSFVSESVDSKSFDPLWKKLQSAMQLHSISH
jgi:hypothetical protein